MVGLICVFVYCVSAHPAPRRDAPPSFDDVEGEQQVDPQTLESLSLTQPSGRKIAPEEIVARPSRKNYYHSYRHELDLHAGTVYGIQDSSGDKDRINVVFGFGYLAPAAGPLHWSLGADLSAVGHGHIHVSRRRIYKEKNAFRPHYEYGVLHKFVPEDRFASISNWDNYLFRAGLGLEELLAPPRSLKVDVYVAAGLKDILIFCTLGVAWGF